MIFLLLFLFVPTFKVSGFEKEKYVSFKSDFSFDYGKICFGNVFSCEDAKVESFGEVKTDELGEYNIYYVAYFEDRKLELEQKVFVVDNTPPEIEVKEKIFSVCPNSEKVSNLEMKIVDDYEGEITSGAEVKFSEGKIYIKIKDAHENFAEKILDGIVEDKEAPEIDLNGAEKYTTIVGREIEIPQPTATDNCNEVGIVASGNVNFSKAGTYVINYSATDEAGNKTEKTRTVVVEDLANGKIIYLTFDDGPSAQTARLLDILKKYNVKATFFVTGNGDDSLILREYQEGHTVALHTYSHNYAAIYQNSTTFFDDLYKIQERVKNITGETVYLMRFPGGSSNTVSARYDGKTRLMSRLVNEVQQHGFAYFDWNISSGDAGGATTAAAVYNNVVSRLNYSSNVVLQHDNKSFSVDAVEDIIKYGLEHGYIFDKLSASSFQAHHGVNN